MHYHSPTNSLKTDKKGIHLLRDPILNKGTAFSREERYLLRLHGLIPPVYHTLPEQVALEWQKLEKEETPFAKHRFLRTLQDTNETLYYALITAYPQQLLPLIYTPTVGIACQEMGRIWTSPRGLMLSYKQKNHLVGILKNAKEKDASVLLVTDGERILGLGDLGLGGINISIGKLSLYTVFGGIHPLRTLPIVLDLGTNNPKKLEDPLYLGLKSPRIKGAEFDDFLSAFVEAVKEVYPNALLQWEDFGKDNARRVLERFQNDLLSFNDDIQGTAGVTLAGLFSALKQTGQTLKEQRFVLYGAGSAAIGISDLIVSILIKEGLTEKEACDKFYILNSKGLIIKSSGLMEQQERYAKTPSDWNVNDPKYITLEETLLHVKPTVLIGTSAQAGAFTEKLVKMLCQNTERPIIFPLSNPNTNCEAHPLDLIKWSHGKAIIATGSPYPDIEYEGKIFTVSQCNNVYIFPGIGLGVIACKARRITDSLFATAATTLSRLSEKLKRAPDSLFPNFIHLRDVSLEIAFAFAKEAIKEGLADDISDEELKKIIEEISWKPSYPEIT
ncbi:MAG: NAD-dependent malic enzyme [Chlamydiae bacterium]|nr:NAD-dependent malic enzyme [Chlamydiota bacterium]